MIVKKFSKSNRSLASKENYNKLELIEGDIHDFKDVYEQMSNDFASEELKEYHHLKSLIYSKKYKLILAKDQMIHRIVGYAFIYELEYLNAIWLDYIAIDKSFQNQGYGTHFIKKIAQSKDNLLGIFQEVEVPIEAKGSMRKNQLRRVNFYERLGAQRLNFPYEFPTKQGGFPMDLYFRPSTNVQILSKKEIQESISEVFRNIHSDVKNRDQILKGFFDSIQDERFILEESSYM